MLFEIAVLTFTLGSLILLFLSFFLILFLIHHKRKQQLHINEKMNLEHHYQSQLLQSRLEVQEQAFKYLSEEIHDNVGQALSTVKLHLYTINQQSAEASKKLIESTSEVLSKAISDLRNISHNLHGGYVSEHGLLEALEKEISYINGAKALKVMMEIQGRPYELSKEKELLIFRIIQEAINNAIKHSGANLIAVNLQYLDEKFTVSIEDDGKGFDAGRRFTNGMGLNNMKTRAGLLGATFHIRSQQEGTQITLSLNSEEDAEN